MAWRSPHERPGRRAEARALLFERLADEAAHTQREARPFRGYDLEGLEASLQRELERLLNTRRGPGPDRPGARRTVLGYGLPDHILDNPASIRDHEVLCRDVAEAIRRYEPRLRSVQVGIAEVHPRTQALTLVIDGEAVLGQKRLAIRFPVAIGGTETV